MIKGALLVLALVLPAVVHADDMFRWRDAKGRVHYSNDPEKIPQGAAPIRTKLGEIGGEPIGPAMAPPAEPRKPAAPEAAAFGAPFSCARHAGLWALPHRSVDLDRPDWYYLDAACGQQRDIEGWLRDAATTLELRKIGL
jgi:hypothetical protein